MEMQLQTNTGFTDAVWDAGTDTQYYGLNLGECVHRPIGTFLTAFVVLTYMHR